MENALGSVLDKLQSLVSKGFLLAGFIPILVFLVLNLWFIYCIFPAYRPSLNGIINSELNISVLENSGVKAVIILLGCFILGLVFWSLNSWFRQFLEGQYLPTWLKDYLTAIQYQLYDAEKRQAYNLRREVALYRREKQSLNDKIRQARATGKLNYSHNQTITMIGREKTSLGINISLYAKELNKVKHKSENWQVIPFNEMQLLCENLKSLLRTYPVDKFKEFNDIEIEKNLKELDRCQREFKDIFEYAASRLENTYENKILNLARLFPQDIAAFGPTQMANLSKIQREYGLKLYGIDIEVIWLQLLRILKTDTNLFPILEEAKTQLDFAVAITMVLGLLTFVWTVIGFFFGSIKFFLLIAIFGPLVIGIFYRITVQNYRTFIDAVFSALDLYRFDLLKSLHLELPTNPAVEKEMWKGLMGWTGDMNRPDFNYKHPEQEKKKETENAEDIVKITNK